MLGRRRAGKAARQDAFSLFITLFGSTVSIRPSRNVSVSSFQCLDSFVNSENSLLLRQRFDSSVSMAPTAHFRTFPGIKNHYSLPDQTSFLNHKESACIYKLGQLPLCAKDSFLTKTLRYAARRSSSFLKHLTSSWRAGRHTCT